MGRTLADEVADDVSRLLLNTNDFAENVIHHPFQGEVVPDIPAIVQEFPPQRAIDTDEGVVQVFTAEILIATSYDESVVVGAGTEVSKFRVRGNLYRSVGKSEGRGSLIVNLERRVTKSVKKGFRSGTS